MAFFLQLGVVWVYEKRLCSLSETTFGAFGGVTNAFSSFCLLIATKVALPLEKGLIFPCFAAVTMILCNIWANRLYQEQFNFKATCCCVIGIFLGSLG